MAAIQDAEYVKLCAQLASALSISLASARRQVDQAAAKEGKRDIVVAGLGVAGLPGSNRSAAGNPGRPAGASERDANFMLED